MTFRRSFGSRDVTSFLKSGWGEGVHVESRAIV